MREKERAVTPRTLAKIKSKPGKAPRVDRPGKSSRSSPKRESLEAKQVRCRDVIAVLERTYPDSKCSLDHDGPFQLLCATILSAQCTDERVNRVTPALFAAYPDAPALARARLPDVEALIRSTGFFKNKARSLVEMAQGLVDRHGARVPGDLEALTALRGVGRKTANVILGVAFGVPGFVVDTHIGRLSRRLGFTRQTDPVKVEHEMMEIAPREKWVAFGHLLISHGRARCMARKPDCPFCELGDVCPRVGVSS